MIETFSSKPFKSSFRISNEDLDAMLKEKQTQLTILKENSFTDSLKSRNDNKDNWADQVNRKRRLIASCLDRQVRLNLKDACRFTGCSFAMVKRVYHDLLYQSKPQEFEYPNLKCQEEIKRLKDSIEEVDGAYSTIDDLKRKHPNFSRKWISKGLKNTGHRWLLMTKKRKIPLEKNYSAKEVIEVVSHLAQSIVNEQIEVLYIDEAHFPLVQTSTHHWTTRNPNKEELVYNRRPVEETKLSVIAVCSLKSFIAMQVFKKDITADDFHYFLQEVLKRYDKSKKVTILADNASWHKTDGIIKSRAGKFLFFNARGLFQSNAIENCFSFIRSDFRKRPLVSSLEEEASLLVNIFFDKENPRRFKGIARNHLRALRMLLKRNSSKVMNTEKEN